MIKPISLRLRYTQALNQAHAIIIKAGRGDELKRAYTPTEAELASGPQARRTRALVCGGVTCSEKAFVSQCASRWRPAF